MTRSIASLLSLTLLAGGSLSAPNAEACNGSRSVSYRVSTPATHVVRTEYALAAPAPTVAVATATKSVVAQFAAARVAAPLPEIEVGSVITASLSFLGSDSGYVMLQIGPATLGCEVVEWSNAGVTFKVPKLALQSPTDAKLVVLRADGRVVRSFNVALAEPPVFIAQSEAQFQASASVQETSGAGEIAEVHAAVLTTVGN